MFAKWDAYLDSTQEGPHWLRNPDVAQLVSDALHYRDGRVYNFDTFCLMSNHVHVTFTPLEKEDRSFHSLSSIMHSLKIYTALKGNDILKREGQFWQHENYDHYVRNEAELVRIRKYILNNPVKAGLVESWDEWPWTYCKYL
jgi:putative transposase